MNFLAKGVLMLFALAVGVVPALVLHADPLLPAGADRAAQSDLQPEAWETAEPDDSETEPSVDELELIPEPEEPTWWDWSRTSDEDADDLDEDDLYEDDRDDDKDDRDDDRADRKRDREEDPVDTTPSECSYYDRSGCGPGDGYGQTEPSESPADPYDPYDPYDPNDPYGQTEPTADPAATEPAPTEPEPTATEDDGGVLGDLLGG